MSAPGSFEDHVGPVLEAGETALAVIAAIRELNEGVKVRDRGSYVRVLVPRRCRVTRDAIEHTLGRPFRLPGDRHAFVQGNVQGSRRRGGLGGRKVMSLRRTYWHLEPLGRKPSDYDVATSNLLYYVGRGFEVHTPLDDWYRRHQRDSPLRCRDWERFRDPRETTYSKYTDLQRRRETFVEGLLASVETTDHNRRLSPAWLRVLDSVLGPLRYPVHGLQMAAAYVGSMAPSGRIVIASLLQSADEIRRVQWLAYRMRQLQEKHEGFGIESKTVWERDPAWQPLRKVIERLLVTFDWGEALVALNLVVKPGFDELFMVEFARLAAACGDEALQKLFVSLNEDCAWHRDWTRQLLRLALADDPGNGTVIRGWLAKWRPEVAAAVEAFAGIIDEVSVSAAGLTFADVRRRIEAFLSTYWASLEPGNQELAREGRA